MHLIKQNGEYVLNKATEDKIKQLQSSIDTLSAQLDVIKIELKNEIEKHIQQEHKIDYKKSDVKITYVEPTTKETFDSKKFKEENQDLYNKYIKISEVKSSIRFKIDNK